DFGAGIKYDVQIATSGEGSVETYSCVGKPLRITFSDATPPVQRAGVITTSESPAFKIVIPADGILSITGAHDWGMFVTASDGTEVYANWFSNFGYDGGKITLTAGTYLFEYENADAETDYDFTFAKK
ncbi:MAG: hypothetical protein LBT48_03995, partial [Prevotellaceae bacterium]|nr:hypothetical protein [Prevotellaceae bacterium]